MSKLDSKVGKVSELKKVGDYCVVETTNKDTGVVTNTRSTYINKYFNLRVLVSPQNIVLEEGSEKISPSTKTTSIKKAIRLAKKVFNANTIGELKNFRALLPKNIYETIVDKKSGFLEFSKILEYNKYFLEQFGEAIASHGVDKMSNSVSEMKEDITFINGLANLASVSKRGKIRVAVK